MSLYKADLEMNDSESTTLTSWRTYILTDIDEEKCIFPLSAYCFMTGLIDSISFSAIFVWCAFQTGNTIQLSLALARLFDGQHNYTMHIADQQAICSLFTFIFGAFIARIGNKMGCKTRGWLALGTLIQTLFTMVAAIAIWKSGQGSVADARSVPAWSNALTFVGLGFMSASMGLQGIMAKRLGTEFTTTVVLTTTWCELMADPNLLVRRFAKSRDHKVLAISLLFLGGFSGRALLDAIGSPGALGIGAGIRLFISGWWLLVPAKSQKL